MAQHIFTQYTDDITGEVSGEIKTHTFALDGITYEIDLGEKTYQELLNKLGPYLTAARKTSSPSRMQSKRRLSAGHGPDPVEVRKWAQRRGIEVHAQGPIAISVIEQYMEEH
ncbi:Lsr2 family protein (plasmid) [Embleya sp. NBC_00888]|uniref:histone-like nucleoid-structuring protein Lsr2 n=1 Tax=Embleya sp. NBC_00888 TaxID=2975960 RepID=UPI002F9067CD|nr:Lsr2 family protein [Embleya sp. NBC_00888]